MCNPHVIYDSIHFEQFSVMPPVLNWSYQKVRNRCRVVRNNLAKHHTYIIDYYNPSVRIFDLVYHTIHVMCISFTDKWRDQRFKVDSEQETFLEIIHDNFVYSQSFCHKSADRNQPKKLLLYFIYMSGLVPEPWLYVQ